VDPRDRAHRWLLRSGSRTALLTGGRTS
jgi:hypothetical protein